MSWSWILFLSGMLVGAPTDSKRKLYQKARAYYKAGQFSQAEPLFLELVGRLQKEQQTLSPQKKKWHFLTLGQCDVLYHLAFGAKKSNQTAQSCLYLQTFSLRSKTLPDNWRSWRVYPLLPRRLKEATELYSTTCPQETKQEALYTTSLQLLEQKNWSGAEGALRRLLKEQRVREKSLEGRPARQLRARRLDTMQYLAGVAWRAGKQRESCRLSEEVSKELAREQQLVSSLSNQSGLAKRLATAKARLDGECPSVASQLAIRTKPSDAKVEIREEGGAWVPLTMQADAKGYRRVEVRKSKVEIRVKAPSFRERVEKVEVQRWSEQKVDVSTGEAIVVRRPPEKPPKPAKKPAPFYTQGWFWGVTGGLVAVGVGAGVLLYLNAEQRYKFEGENGGPFRLWETAP